MCFKTAALPSPSTGKKVTKTVNDDATYTVKAAGTRLVQLRIGKRASATQFAQIFGPEDLREFAKQLNVLADELEA